MNVYICHCITSDDASLSPTYAYIHQSGGNCSLYILFAKLLKVICFCLNSIQIILVLLQFT